MRQIIKAAFVVTALHVFSPYVSHAQLNTLSPYTRYGLGEINHEGNGRNDALGGISAPLRTNNIINPGNPASYSGQDTLSFFFFVGLKSRFAKYETSADQRTFNNSMLDHVAIGFPITRWMKASAGIYPFSHTGYNINELAVLEETPGQDTLYQSFTGEGGLNNIYFGTGFSIGHGLSIGFNLKYMFGTMNHFNTLTLTENESFYTSTDRSQETQVSGLYFDLGAQYEAAFENSSLTLGTSFRPELNLTGKYDRLVLNKAYFAGQTMFNDTLISINAEDQLTLPMQFRLGAAFSWDNRFLVAAEYDFQQWTSFQFPGAEGNLQNSEDYRVGFEYIPNPTALTGYINHVFFRAGGFFSNTYLQLNDTQITDSGITAGLGLPFRGSRTTFNISYRYGIKGVTDNGLMKESYHQFKISLSMYDIWFVQSKYD